MSHGQLCRPLRETDNRSRWVAGLQELASRATTTGIGMIYGSGLHYARHFESKEIQLPNHSLVDWPDNQLLQDHVIRARHRLLDTQLFSDEKLIELFDRHDPDELLVYRMGDNHHNLDDFQFGSRGKLTATELLDAVRAGKLWLNILNMTTNHEHFDELVDNIYDELEEKVLKFKTVYRSANLLVSSPNSQVYYHADAPLNMLWHLRGEKRVWVYPGDERFAPREWVEMIFTRESDDDLPYSPEFDQFATAYDLCPGDMLTWSQNTPHRVENLSGLNVSLTTEHYTPEAMKKRMTYLSNHYLRRWFGLPTTDVTLHGPSALMKRTMFRVARRLPGFHEAVEYDDDSKFSLNR